MGIASSAPRLLLAAAALLTALGFAAERADASYTAVVSNGRLVVTGNQASDQLALRLQSGVPTTLQVDVGNDGTANFSFDRSLFDRIVVNAGSGNDTVVIDQANGAFTDPLGGGEASTITGGAGNDTIAGGAGAQILNGGAGNDTLDPNQGDDRALGGDGNDTVVWDPGDGSDVIRSGDGSDLLAFRASAASEVMQISANGPRLAFFRNVGNINLDVDGLERVVLDALGGADTITVGNLKATDVARVTIDLEGLLGGGSGDGQADAITVNATARADTLNVGPQGGATVASGLKAAVVVLRSEAANDRLVLSTAAADRVNVNGTGSGNSLSVAPSPTGGARVTSPLLTGPVDVVGGTLALRGMGGNDTLTGTGNLAVLPVSLRFEGGSGNDFLAGGNGVDRLLGGPGNDTLDGNQGNDRAFGESGNDTVVWDPGDGSDILRGGTGGDRLAFNTSAASEVVELSANGPRLRLTRNVGNILLDVDAVERVVHQALGGADTIVIRNLKPTDVSLVTLDLEGVLGGGAADGQADAVTVNGTSKRDVVHVAAVAGAAEVSGLRTRVRILHSEVALDHLTINGLGGNDRITVGSGLPALIGLTVNQ